MRFCNLLFFRVQQQWENNPFSMDDDACEQLANVPYGKPIKHDVLAWNMPPRTIPQFQIGLREE